MSMITLGLRNLTRSKPRLLLTAVLIGVPFFLLLAMQSIGQAVQKHTDVLTREVNTVVQLRARGSMGHVNMTDQDRICLRRCWKRCAQSSMSCRSSLTCWRWRRSRRRIL